MRVLMHPTQLLLICTGKSASYSLLALQNEITLNSTTKLVAQLHSVDR